jgi:hypothetical protein
MNAAKLQNVSSAANSLKSEKRKPVVTVRDAIRAQAFNATVRVTTTGKDSAMQEEPRRPYNSREEGSNWQPIRKGSPSKAQQIINKVFDKFTRKP